MALIANYRAIKHDDADALLLAQRWSKYMAVTFAVGAVTGTVLTFEFGLLWPTFMGRFGDAFGIPFAIEGLFFFTEAIFIAIYIYGWKRLKPWPHFWTGVPIVIAGIGGTVSVVAANAWMNEPAGFTLNSAGKVVDVDPSSVIFNKAMPYEAAHMLVAAYLVGGFLIASVYAVGMLRGRRDRYHRLGFIIPFTVAAIATPIQMVVGDTLARWVYNNEPTKFAAIELVPEDGERRARDAVRAPRTPTARSAAASRSPGLASIALRSRRRHEHGRPGPQRVPDERAADDPRGERRPPRVGRHGRPRRRCCSCCRSGTGCPGCSAATSRRRKLFLWIAAGAGVASVLALEAGWVVTEVGRQPWIVYNYMKVEQAATTNGGVWITFLVDPARSTSRVGVTLDPACCAA